MDKLLSLCMIVKNEEKVLARCLESVQGFVDEIIVVDTGSTDQTKAIALQYTDHIYDFEWINDFSAAKNEAIRRATSQWILVLDADEYLDTDQKDELRTFLSKTDSDLPIGYVLPIYNFIETIQSGKFLESTAVRLFPNSPNLYFERPIHEQLVYRNGEIINKNYPLTLFHTGYLAETQLEKEKSSRNLNIFKDLKSSKNFTEYDYFTLGNEYLGIKDYKKALYYYERALTKNAETLTIFPFCRYQIVLTLIDLRRYKDALTYIEDNIKRWPQHPDYYSIKASVYENLGLYEESIDYYLTAIQKAEDYKGKDDRFWLITPTLGTHTPLSSLVRLYQRAQNIPQAVYYLTKLVNLNDNDHLSLFRLLNLLIQNESTPSILTFLGKIFNFELPQHLNKLLHVSLLLGHKELCQFFYQECAKHNIALQPYQVLYYAVIFNDQERFNKILTDNKELTNSGQVNKLLFYAAILWQDNTYGHYLSESSNEDDLSLLLLQNIFNTLFDSHESDEEIIFDINFIVTLLIDLFKMGYYDSYDWLIQQYPLYFNILANLLGDYFYNHNQIQLAVDYYSLLLKNNQLSGPGYYHLSLIYLNQGETTEGLSYLQTAIERCPEQATWYILYANYSPSSAHRDTILQKYRNEFHQYCQIEVIQQKIKS
ncbi:glycosyltransferase [Cohnella sp. WQ 127256]|uniref:glycosyltransferase n=1 Tax=Cohnella sp. WQ 127256 TaxID=2938790 RepID=UPI0021190102|nr:glycosyltransferase [Cohnella sp. WQ 127256]